jgi:hypothetical protein
MSATKFGGNQTTSADVVIRQIWIHGSHMRVLENRVLKDSLEIQNAILYGTFPSSGRPDDKALLFNNTPKSEVDAVKVNGCDPFHHGDSSWDFHSPLMYWNCSSDTIENDKNLVVTINSQTSRRSYRNLTLRPSSVLAGKSFVGNKLLAADALVLTLFDQSPSSFNIRLWSERLSDLAALYSDRWTFYPEAGTMIWSQLFRFQFKPISTSDDFMLIGLYIGMLVYAIFNLSKAPRAVRSPLGLILTVVTEVFELLSPIKVRSLHLQMILSVVASFTICAILRIDLARIPQEVYPFVVLGIGPENM